MSDDEKHREVIFTALERAKPKPYAPMFDVTRAGKVDHDAATRAKIAERDEHDAAVKWLEERLK